MDISVDLKYPRYRQRNVIGSITEYYTSDKYKPTKKLAEMAIEGEAFVITKGDAIGSRSTLLPILIIGIALFISGKISGTYGIAISALGMLFVRGSNGFHRCLRTDRRQCRWTGRVLSSGT